MLYLGSWAPISVLRSFSVLLIGFLQVLQFPSTSQNMPVGRLYDKKKPLVLSECLSMDAHGDLQWTDNPSSGSTLTLTKIKQGWKKVIIRSKPKPKVSVMTVLFKNRQKNLQWSVLPSVNPLTHKLLHSFVLCLVLLSRKHYIKTCWSCDCRLGVHAFAGVLAWW